MINEIILRFQRYRDRYGLFNAIATLIILALAVRSWPSLTFHWLGLFTLGFLTPYFFRYSLIKRIETPLMNYFDSCFFLLVIAIGAILLIYTKKVISLYEVVPLLALNLGIEFWTRTDEMYVMISWLAHPLEYGTPPDDISLLCKMPINWRGFKETCHVFRFRYEETISAGISRPIVFSFMDPIGDLSSVEIVEKYKQWFESDGLRVIERDSQDHTTEEKKE